MIRKGHVVVRNATKAISKGTKKKHKSGTTKTLLGGLANGTKKSKGSTTKKNPKRGATATKKHPATANSNQKRPDAGGESQDLEPPAPQISAKRDSWLELEAFIHPSASQLSVMSEADED